MGRDPKLQMFWLLWRNAKVKPENPEVENTLRMLHATGLRNAILTDGDWM